MPTHLFGQRAVLAQFAKTDATPVQVIEAQSHDARLPCDRIFAVRKPERHHCDAAQALRVFAQRLEHQPVVRSVHADLHQHAVGHARGVEHGQVLIGSRARRRVGALVHKRVLGRSSDHMGMRVDRVRRNREAGRAALLARRRRAWRRSVVWQGRLLFASARLRGFASRRERRLAGRYVSPPTDRVEIQPISWRLPHLAFG